MATILVKLCSLSVCVTGKYGILKLGLDLCSSLKLNLYGTKSRAINFKPHPHTNIYIYIYIYTGVESGGGGARGACAPQLF